MWKNCGKAKTQDEANRDKEKNRWMDFEEDEL